MNLLSRLFRKRTTKPLDWTNPKMAKLALELQHLDALPLSSKNEVAAWDAAAESFHQKLYAEYSDIYDTLPHEIEHYLSDSGIRARDAAYAEYQRGLLAELLKYRNEK